MRNSYQVGAIGTLNEMKFIKIKKNEIYCEYLINNELPSIQKIWSVKMVAINENVVVKDNTLALISRRIKLII